MLCYTTLYINYMSASIYCKSFVPVEIEHFCVNVSTSVWFYLNDKMFLVNLEICIYITVVYLCRFVDIYVWLLAYFGFKFLPFVCVWNLMLWWLVYLSLIHPVTCSWKLWQAQIETFFGVHPGILLICLQSIIW